MLRIVLFSHTFLPQIGGRELVVYHLARELVRQGHDVRVFGSSNWRSRTRLDFGFPVRRYPSLVRVSLGRSGFLGKLREAEYATHFVFDRLRSGCDIVHAHTTYPAGFTAARWRHRKAPWGLVVTPHGVDIHTIPDLGHGMRLRPGFREKIARSLAEADALTAISGSIRASLVDAGADPDKIWDIPNGVDCARFAIAGQRSPMALKSVPPGAPLVVTVGNYHPRKGQEVLLHAMPSIVQRVPQTRLVVVGRGTERLCALAESLGVAGNVVLTGPVAFPMNGRRNAEDDVLAEILARSALYVSAGTEEGAEGLSLAILEAMAAGVPVVATDISGNRDVVIGGINGQLVAPGDPVTLANAIVTMLEDDIGRSRMGKNARAHAETYGWEHAAHRYVDVYQEILARRSA